MEEIKMSKNFEAPELTIITFDTSDIITASGDETEETTAATTRKEDIGEWDFA